MEYPSPSVTGSDDSCGEPSTSPSTAPTTPDTRPLLTTLRAHSLGGINFSHLADDELSERNLDSPVEGLAASLVPPTVRRICCIGAGYVGGPTAAVVALHNPAIRVEVLDRDQARIDKWRSPHLPIHEPGLDRIVRVVRDGAQATDLAPEAKTVDGLHVGGKVANREPNLFFTTDSQKSISNADLILLAVNTPTKTFGLGAGRATNMAALDGAVRDVARLAKAGAIIVEKSTVPCGTAQRIRQTLETMRPGVPFEILSNPEFLSEGTAVKNLLNPDRVIIGSSDTASGRLAAEALATVYSSWVPRSKVLGINAWSSELSKLVANAMLAQRISSINSVSAICERTGADIQEIAKSIGLDPRIGPQFLKAGLGFGGSCFRKDICSLTYLAESLGLDDVAHYWAEVNRMNELQRQRFAKRVLQRLQEDLVGKKIAVLGFAFKGNTGDTRESPVVDVIGLLLEERPSEIAIFDPYCSEAGILQELGYTTDSKTSKSSVTIYTNPYEACHQADAVLVMTDCEQFRYSTSSPRKIEAPKTVALGTNSQEDVLLTESTVYHLTPRLPCPHDCQECNVKTVRYNSTEPVDWARLVSAIREPKIVFDGRNILDVASMLKLGVHVESIGRRSASS